jgi:hypothetical protein
MQIWTTTHISNLLYSLGYVSFNMLQERMNPRYACSWFGMNLPNHHFSDGIKEMSAIRRIYNRSTHS